jgi:tellurite resistance protein TerC
VLGLLALDLGVFHRKAHAVSMREATLWSMVWIALALAFNGAIYLLWEQVAPTSTYTNREATLAFFTGYLLEKSLSVDNIFVFVLIFTYFSVSPSHQHRILFWGILGALLLRGTLITVGSTLLAEFHWVIYLFGAFLIFTGVRMAFFQGEAIDPDHNPFVRAFRRLMPVTPDYVGTQFFVRQAGVWMATPLFLVLLIVESTDLVFALDSIPAIFAITHEPFLVYTSNVFAILGLRSLYFLLAGAVHQFYYLKPGLSIVLVFVGLKMVAADFYTMPIATSLAFIGSVLGLAVVASLLRGHHMAVPPALAPLERSVNEADLTPP